MLGQILDGIGDLGSLFIGRQGHVEGVGDRAAEADRELNIQNASAFGRLAVLDYYRGALNPERRFDQEQELGEIWHILSESGVSFAELALSEAERKDLENLLWGHAITTRSGLVPPS